MVGAPSHDMSNDDVWRQVFLKVADVYFNGVANLDQGKSEGKFSGQLYGYGGNQTGVYRCASRRSFGAGKYYYCVLSLVVCCSC